jgi:two-component sensor histidine kinase
VAEPAARGFGTRLLHSLFGQTGKVNLEFLTEGVRCTLKIPREGG